MKTLTAYLEWDAGNKPVCGLCAWDSRSAYGGEKFGRIAKETELFTRDVSLFTSIDRGGF